MLRDVTESASKRLGLFVPDVGAANGQCALVGFDQAVERPQQCGLSRTAFSNESGDRAGQHAK